MSKISFRLHGVNNAARGGVGRMGEVEVKVEGEGERRNFLRLFGRREAHCDGRDAHRPRGCAGSPFGPGGCVKTPHPFRSAAFLFVCGRITHQKFCRAGLKIFNPGNSDRKSSSLRVMRPPFDSAYAHQSFSPSRSSFIHSSVEQRVESNCASSVGKLPSIAR